jgi:hypothetical protein
MIDQAIRNAQTGVQFVFLDIDCIAIREQYESSRSTCLSIVAADTERNRLSNIPFGAPVCTATINLEYLSLSDDEVVIKNYSENHGLLPVLLAAGVVTHTQSSIGTPFGILPLVKVNTNALAELQAV